MTIHISLYNFLQIGAAAGVTEQATAISTQPTTSTMEAAGTMTSTTTLGTQATTRDACRP